MSENVGASTSRNPKGLHGLHRDDFTLPYKFTYYAILCMFLLFNPSWVTILPSVPFSRTQLSLSYYINIRDQVFHPHINTGTIIVLYILIFMVLDEEPERSELCRALQEVSN
jgi:hypothetical protein